jgi:hypothetical protein
MFDKQSALHTGIALFHETNQKKKSFKITLLQLQTRVFMSLTISVYDEMFSG